MKASSIVLVGATGLCGNLVMSLLLEHPACASLTILVRRKVSITHPKLNQVICDYQSFSPEMMPSCDHVFCCLGTTIKVAGSQEAFEAVDRHYPVAVAKAAHAKGATSFNIITALGSDPNSRIFYSRVKGMCEADLQTIGFDRLLILRPSMILGERTEKRSLEHLGQVWMQRLAFLIPHMYRAVPASCIAEVMVREGLSDTLGVRILLSDQIRC